MMDDKVFEQLENKIDQVLEKNRQLEERCRLLLEERNALNPRKGESYNRTGQDLSQV